MNLKREAAIFIVAALILGAGSMAAFASSDNNITAKQALDVIMDFMPDCDVESFQRMTSSGLTVYQYAVTDGGERYIILINATSGEIESYSRETGYLIQNNTPQAITVIPAVPETTVVPATPGYINNQVQASVSADNARNAALAKVGGGTVARVETHYPPHGNMEYKVIIIYGDNKYCVHVSGNEASVTDMHMEPVIRTGPNAHNSSATISSSSAMSTAIQNTGGGIVTECTLEYKPHNGSLTYHIHVVNGLYEFCVELDATAGTVYKVEQRYKP